MSLLKSSFTVGGLTLLSRLFGFLRDMVMAFLLGAGMQTDAFFVAFKLPNFMRRLFAEGAFNSAFLPMFAGKLKTEGREDALRFASEAFTLLLLILLIVTAIAMLFMPQLMFVLAPGFSNDPEKFALTVTLTRITFPYLIFISLICLLGGVLNSFDRFAAVASAPIVMNVTIIGAMLLLPAYMPTPAHALSVGVLLAGVGQYAWLALACRRDKTVPKLVRPRLSPDMKKLLLLIGPAALGAGVVQVNLLIDVIIASTMEHAVSYLYYADRLYELPLGVIGIAVATALLPRLSREVRSGEKGEALKLVNESILLVAFFGLPAAAALLMIAHPVIMVLFEHGQFSAGDTMATAPALIAYAAGLPSFLLVKIFASVFFAAQDTRTPVRVAIVAVIVNLVFNLILMQFFAHVGLAMATSISGWVNAAMLGILLHRRGMFLPGRKLMFSCLKMAGATGGMMLALWGLKLLLEGWLGGPLWQAALALGMLITGGAAVYFLLAFALGVLNRRILGKLTRGA